MVEGEYRCKVSVGDKLHAQVEPGMEVNRLHSQLRDDREELSLNHQDSGEVDT